MSRIQHLLLFEHFIPFTDDMKQVRLELLINEGFELPHFSLFNFLGFRHSFTRRHLTGEEEYCCSSTNTAPSSLRSSRNKVNYSSAIPHPYPAIPLKTRWNRASQVVERERE
eukprot:c25682_g1_i2 orf=2-334(-)